MTTLTVAPDAPSRNDDPTTFASKADAFVAWQENFPTEMNLVIGEVQTAASNAAADAASASVDAASADVDATAAALSAASANSDAASASASAAAAETFADEAGLVFVATSTTSNTIGTGSKSFTVVEATARAFGIGSNIRVARTSAPTTTYMDGIVTAYTHPSVTISFTSSTGSGTHTDWTLTVQGTTVGSAPSAWQVKTTTYTAVAGDRLFIDTSGGAWTLTLPASATLGDTIELCDYAGTFGDSGKNLTLGRNGLLIMGLAENNTVSTSYAAFRCVYSGATYGWRFA